MRRINFIHVLILLILGVFLTGCSAFKAPDSFTQTEKVHFCLSTELVGVMYTYELPSKSPE